jgi:acetyl-CoA C-acetyltransferase
MRQCGSGLQAIHNAAQAIMVGEADIVVAGGVESMSRAPYYLRHARYGYKAGNAVLVDSNTESQPRSQPIEVYGANLTMGLTAENLAVKYGIGREEQTFFALRSQDKALAAIDSGRFGDEIVAVEIPRRKARAGLRHR